MGKPVAPRFGQMMNSRGEEGGGGLATAFDLAAFQLSMIAPVTTSGKRVLTSAKRVLKCEITF